MAQSDKIRVAVDGYGVIGKRVAAAVALQVDMSMVGVADVSADCRLRVAHQQGSVLYGATAPTAETMRYADLPVADAPADLIEAAGVVGTRRAA